MEYSNNQSYNYQIMDDPAAKIIIGKFVRKCYKNVTYLNRLVN
jgi:hypothetical protein